MQTLLERPDERAGEKKPRRPGRKSARLQQGARLTLIAGMAMFILFQVGLRWFIDQRRPEWRDPGFEIKYRQFARQKAPFAKEPGVVLFLGSSITAGGMKPDMCEAPLSSALQRPVVAFNFGTPCGGPFTQLVYVQRLLRRGVRPELVVFELSPLFLDFADDPVDAARFPGYVLEHADLATVNRYSHDDGIDEEWWQACLVPVYGHRLAILNHASKALVAFPDQLDLYDDMTPHGWRKRNPTTAEERGRTLVWVRDNHVARLAKHFVGQSTLKALDEALALLAREKIPTLLVRLPEGPLMRSLYSQKSIAEIELAFANLSERHQFPLVDCSDWFDEDHFVDSFHMTYVAAEKLTGRLLQERILPHFIARRYAGRDMR